MDASRFDGLVQSFDGGSRRSILTRLVGVALSAVMLERSQAMVEAGKKGHHHRHKKKKHQKPKPPPFQCYASAQVACSDGVHCCDDDAPVCCDFPVGSNTVACYSPGSHCCPLDLGSGGCAQDQTCCPAPKGSVLAACARTAQGHHCCGAESGGFCAVDQSCCPSATTNSKNFGCGPIGVTCCNVDTDCPAGETCHLYDGWCFR